MIKLAKKIKKLQPPPKEDLKKAKKLSKRVSNKTEAAGINYDDLIKKARVVRNEVRSKHNSTSSDRY